MTPEEIIKTISERVKDTANVKVVFGEPVVSAGVTIIPVAAVKVAGGGGGSKGRSPSLPIEGTEQSDGGLGLGLQISAKPIGYIEVKDGKARLIPIADVTKIAVVGMITGTLALMVAGKLLTKWGKMRYLKRKWRMHQARI